jgi:hypothetical protein
VKKTHKTHRAPSKKIAEATIEGAIVAVRP